MLNTITKPSRYLLDVVFPPRCGHCGGLTESHGRVCAPCWSSLTFLSAPCCAACGYPFAYEMAETDALCAACMQYKPAYDAHRSMLKFDEHSKKLVHDLKYHDKPLLLPLLAEWLCRAGEDFLTSSSDITEQGEARSGGTSEVRGAKPPQIILLPVPLHFLRLISRRYNQAALLAKALSLRTGLPYLPDGLKRVKRRPPQAGLSRDQRLKNMRGVFTINPKRKSLIQGKTVILIDDVMTTGATLNACARTLKRAGAARVYAITLARTVLEG